MKVRTGFVSNSSSSSYIVDIDGITIKDFYETILEEYGYDLFDKETVEKEVHNYCDKIDKLISIGSTFHELVEIWKNQADKRRNDFDKVTTKRKLVDFVFKYNNITVEKTKFGIKLKGEASMHNDFNDMPKIVRELTLFFMMDTSYDVSGRRLNTS